MNLRKQFVTAFLSVAIIPLVMISLYLFGTNIRLAFQLYGQNLYNSTELQNDLLEELTNNLMVRLERMAKKETIVKECGSTIADLPDNKEAFSEEINRFTDETLNSVTVYAVLNVKGDILFSSGSNKDNAYIVKGVESLNWSGQQYAFELFLENQTSSIAVFTPVMKDGKTVGGIIAVCKADYFLKKISSHRQVENSNAFLYCLAHERVIAAKNEISEDVQSLSSIIGQRQNGSEICKVGNERVLICFSKIAKTPWYIVNSIPVGLVFSLVLKYSLVSGIILLFVIMIILLLSVRQSKKILLPLELLLSEVEQFFVSGAGKFRKPQVDSKTEIGYLAGKFEGMSDEIITAQYKLRESNLLYRTLLKATYKQRIVIDLKEAAISCSAEILEERINSRNGESSLDKVLDLLSEECGGDSCGQQEKLSKIVRGIYTETAETEVCCNMTGVEEACWYRMISVPIIDDQAQVSKVVLHFEDITEKKKEEFQLIQKSQLDPLCGLLNKKAFLKHCQKSAAGLKDVIFFIDLDQFKQINDSLGHAEGDAVLVETAGTIRMQFRSTDVLGRYGGDEFVVFAPNMTKEQAIMRATMLVKALVFERSVPQGGSLRVTASIGVYIIQENVELAYAIEKADEAMYCAKQNGKSRFHIVDDRQEGG